MAVGLPPSRCSAHTEILLNGQVFEWLPTLQDLNDPIPGDRFGSLVLDLLVLIENRTVSDLAIFRFEKTSYSLKGRSFSCSIASEQGDDTVFFNGERNPLEHLDHI